MSKATARKGEKWIGGMIVVRSDSEFIAAYHTDSPDDLGRLAEMIRGAEDVQEPVGEIIFVPITSYVAPAFTCRLERSLGEISAEGDTQPVTYRVLAEIGAERDELLTVWFTVDLLV